MLTQNKKNKQNKQNIKPHILSLMGITQWHLREVIFTSTDHTACVFYLCLTQSLTPSQKTFLIKLYQAIEKKLTLPPSNTLIKKQAPTLLAPLACVKVQLYFNQKTSVPLIIHTSPILIIHLPDMPLCEKTPKIKHALWNLLKNHL